MPERDRGDDQVMVADIDQDAVVTDAVPPIAGKLPGARLCARRDPAANAGFR